MERFREDLTNVLDLDELMVLLPEGHCIRMRGPEMEPTYTVEEELEREERWAHDC